jgi:hypothetical protein
MVEEKAELINKYQEIRAQLGKAPSSREFMDLSKVSERTLRKLFGSNAFSKLSRECGDVPNDFFTEKVTIEAVFRQWGEILRKEQKVPTQADWLFNKCSPTPNRIDANYKIKWSDLPRCFLNYARDKPEWQDVIHLIDIPENIVVENNEENDLEVDSLEYRNYLPKIVANLESLAQDENLSLEFEKKVNLVFQFFGFEMEDLGQGTGRNPDGIARNRQNHYAILIDAKSRRDKYSIGTEDRKFIEYLKKYQPILKKEGYEIVYFIVISSRFTIGGNASVENVFRETNAKLSFMTAENLMKILSKKIGHPNSVDMSEFKELLLNGGLITDQKVVEYLRN